MINSKTYIENINKLPIINKKINDKIIFLRKQNDEYLNVGEISKYKDNCFKLIGINFVVNLINAKYKELKDFKKGD